MRPGIMTTVVCALTANYFWISPTHSFLVGDPGDLIALVLFAAIGTLISALNEAWRRTTLEAAVSRERLRTTLMSIGDAVIGTDAGGRITLMNAVAETLTGWRETAARGRPLREVLVIVNEDSRAEVENPVEKVLRDEANAAGLTIGQVADALRAEPRNLARIDQVAWHLMAVDHVMSRARIHIEGT